jgi:mevalonate kinase
MMLPKFVSVSVPGKVHLMGEHAVVYGKPAILAAVDLRMRIGVRGLPAGKSLKVASSEPDGYVRKIVEMVIKTYAIEHAPPMEITIDSDIPAGYHLGSSAATAVGVIGALSYFLKGIWNPQAINQLAYEAEKLQHGTPSGSDNTAVTMGGLLWYRKELEFLRSMWQLPMKIPPQLNNFYLIDTGRSEESTGEMVSFVRSQVAMRRAQYLEMFDENERQTKRVAVAIRENLEPELIDAVRKGEGTLESMGVVSGQVLPVIRAIENAGGAAKILGGGGRKAGAGYLLCYHRDIAQVKSAARSFGFGVRPVVLGGDGVKLEKQ